MVIVPEKIVQKLCAKVLDTLKDKRMVTLKAPEDKVLQRLAKAMLDDLNKEAALNNEVRKMLEKFRPQIDRGEVDEHKMFQMIKKQLVKDRGIVL